MSGHTDQASLSGRAAYLTERQRQVLRSVARGYRTREIAQMLGVSVKAVHKQRERLRIALQLNSIAALTRFAVREGFAEDSPATLKTSYPGARRSGHLQGIARSPYAHRSSSAHFAHSDARSAAPG